MKENVDIELGTAGFTKEENRRVVHWLVWAVAIAVGVGVAIVISLPGWLGY